MEIAIKSEADSRILVYPLIKSLYNYGTIIVFTSNKYMSRLIENELEGGFKNVRIVVSPEADLEGSMAAEEYFDGKYDFTIFDNMGATDYDMLIAIVTNRLSESYMQDLLYLCTDEKTHIMKFGSPAPTAKGEKPAKQKPEEKKSSKNTEQEEPADEDMSFNKWKEEKTDEEVLQELLSNREAKWIKFPTFDAIEAMEARHYMMVPDDGLIKEIFRLFGSKLCIDIRQFTKGVRVKDESSSDISGTDVR